MPSDNDPRVLVSILNYCQFEATADCVRSFRQQTYEAMELQVIDNASPDGSAGRLRAAFPDLTVIEAPENLGYTGGNNLAIEHAIARSFDHVLVSNADVLVPPHAVASFVETAEAHPEAGVVGAVETDSGTGRVRTAGGTRFPDWRFRIRWRTEEEAGPAAGNSSRAVLFAQGALVFFTRRALDQGVRFDDRLFLYWDEIDLGYELRRKDLRVVVDLRVRFAHRNSPGSFRDLTGYFQQRNRVYLARKHFSPARRRIYMLYATALEVPVKFLVRTLQGHGSFARACVAGHFDGLAGRMGRGKLESLSGAC